jgi:hypothetical protein
MKLAHLINGTIPFKLDDALYFKGHPSKEMVLTMPYFFCKPQLDKVGAKLVDLYFARQLSHRTVGKKILAIQAGKGYLAAALKAVGSKIAAFDACPDQVPMMTVNQGDPETAIRLFEKDSDILLIPWADGNEAALFRGLMHWPDEKEVIVIGQRDRLIHNPMSETAKLFWGMLDLHEMDDIEYPSFRPFMTDKIYTGHRCSM